VLEALVPLLYKELRNIARHHLQRERPGHTLQSAALVHEAYLRLLDQRPFDTENLDTENRAHFLAVASRLMRQILVDYARSHGAAKRGADLRVELDAFARLAAGAEHGRGCARRRSERACPVGRTAGLHC
jgi:RNA polymerase sigma factor (TIGR02999 family)